MTAADPPPTVALVTGATGFAGRHLVRRLVADGWTVHAVTRAASTPRTPLPDSVVIHRAEDVVAEVGALINAIEPMVVFHTAALSAHHQAGRLQALIQANVTFSAAVAEAAAAVGARMLHISSSAKHFQGESYSPVSLYGATKQAQCDLVQFFVEAEGLDAREVCLFDTYGPNDDRGRLVSLLVDAAESGAPLAMSSGRQLIDLTHIDDVVNALVMLALHAEPVGRLVVRSGKPISVRALVETVERVTGRPVNAQWGARPERPREMITDWIVPSPDIGWTPRIGLEEGVAQLWRQRVGGTPT